MAAASGSWQEKNVTPLAISILEKHFTTTVLDLPVPSVASASSPKTCQLSFFRCRVTGQAGLHTKLQGKPAGEESCWRPNFELDLLLEWKCELIMAGGFNLDLKGGMRVADFNSEDCRDGDVVRSRPVGSTRTGGY